MTTIGVVVIGFPYLTFLPTLADERYDVGAGGYGVMAGVAGLGAVSPGSSCPADRFDRAPAVADDRRRRRCARGGAHRPRRSPSAYWTALLALPPSAPPGWCSRRRRSR